MRVIIVDEDLELADLLKVALQVGFYEKAKQLAREGKPVTEGLEVEKFSDRAAALDYLAHTGQRVDLIFTDLQAGVHGFDFLQTCRERYRNKYGDIIVVTDRGRQDEVKRGILAGAKDYILKPFAPEDLREHVFDAWGGGTA